MSTPEIDPELHGLLDEVVHDPRSALRRTPRRALLEWFGNPTSAHARPVDATTAERHLVAVYRESLAELLLKASWLAFHEQPVPRMAPRRPDGTAVDVERESRALWRAVDRIPGLGYERAGRPEAIAMLVSQRSARDPGQASALAELAVALVPSDFGQLRLAVALPDSESRTAILALQRVAHEARASYIRKDAHNAIAQRMVGQGWLHLARGEYSLAVMESPQSVDTRFWSFNLACWAGDMAMAREQGDAIQHLCAADDERIQQAVEVLKFWSRSSPASILRPIVSNWARWGAEFPEPCVRLMKAYS